MSANDPKRTFNFKKIYLDRLYSIDNKKAPSHQFLDYRRGFLRINSVTLTGGVTTVPLRTVLIR